jgi:hypothetical protein
MNYNRVLMATNAAAQLFILHTDSIKYTVTLQTNKLVNHMNILCTVIFI